MDICTIYITQKVNYRICDKNWIEELIKVEEKTNSVCRKCIENTYIFTYQKLLILFIYL